MDGHGESSRSTSSNNSCSVGRILQSTLGHSHEVEHPIAENLSLQDIISSRPLQKTYSATPTSLHEIIKRGPKEKKSFQGDEPAKKKTKSALDNLTRGRGKPKSVEEVGYFKEEKRITERSKILLQKQANDIGLHILKVDNSPSSEGQIIGFAGVMTIGNKTMYVAEGEIGRKCVQETNFFKNLLLNPKAKQIHPELGNSELNATIKAKFIQNTGKEKSPENLETTDFELENSNNIVDDEESARTIEPEIACPSNVTKFIQNTPNENSSDFADLSDVENDIDEPETAGPSRIRYGPHRVRTVSDLISNMYGPAAVNHIHQQKQSSSLKQTIVGPRLKLFNCTICNEKFRSNQELKEHMSDNHAFAH